MLLQKYENNQETVVGTGEAPGILRSAKWMGSEGFLDTATTSQEGYCDVWSVSIYLFNPQLPLDTRKT